MLFFPALFGPARAFALGLVLLAASPVLAQRAPGKTKAKKTKTTTTSTAGTTVQKTKVVTAAAPVAAPAAPQPTSPLVSAPQVVLPAPAATPAGAALGEAPATWLSDLGAAQAQARATNRPVLAVFSGSDWCKPCIMYEQEVFAKPEFTAFATGRLVLAHFDFPRLKRNQPTAAQLKLNEAAAAQLNREGDFPLAVIIAPDGQVLAKTGYIAGGPAAFEAYLKKVIPAL